MVGSPTLAEPQLEGATMKEPHLEGATMKEPHLEGATMKAQIVRRHLHLCRSRQL